jgi:hypothetical protein
MVMSRLTKRLIATGIVLALFLAGWAVFTVLPNPNEIGGNQNNEVISGETASGAPQARSEEQVDPDGSSEHAPSDGPRSKRIVHVPDTRKDRDNSELENAQGTMLLVSNQIDSALEGNADDALRVIQHAHKCVGTLQEEAALTSFIEHHRTHSQLKMTITTGLLGAQREFDSFEEWSATLWQQYEDCRSTNDLLGDELRIRLGSLAMDGNSTARFLYAMLQPTESTESPEGLRQLLEYESLAYKFTHQNIEERNPLGLLALGISYRGNLFTPHHPQVGRAFIYAAEQCGINSKLIEFIPDQIADSRLDSALANSTVIVSEFCY